MGSTPRLRLLIGTVLVLAVAALVPTGLNADHAWGPYHWKKTSASPVVLTLGDNVSLLWEDHLDDAVQDWDQSNQSSVLDLSVVAGGTSPRSCRPKSGKIEVC